MRTGASLVKSVISSRSATGNPASAGLPPLVAAREAADAHRGAKAHYPPCGNAHRLARARIPGTARLTGSGAGNTEPPEHHPVATLQGGTQTLEQGLHGLPRNAPFEICGVHRPGEEVGLHRASRILCDSQSTRTFGARGKVRKRQPRPETRSCAHDPAMPPHAVRLTSRESRAGWLRFRDDRSLREKP